MATTPESVLDHRPLDDQSISVEHTSFTSIADPALALSADVLDDLENTRKANSNRLDHLTRATSDSDGRVRGLGYAEDSPEVSHLLSLIDELDKIEAQATKNLQRRMKSHPLGPWVKEQAGVGDKQAARLLAVVGDPYLHEWADEDNTVHLRPRTVGQLWAYCGHGDPSRRKKKGMTQAEAFALGNPTAKMRVWNIANAMIKTGVRKTEDAAPTFSPDTRVAISPWGQVYLDRRAATIDHTHSADCVRCGPSGKPAEVGTPWSAAHQQADALRVTGKTFLKALWIEARRLHGVTD